MKDGNIVENDSQSMITRTNIANDGVDDDGRDKDNLLIRAPAVVMKITKIMMITSVITVVTMMMKIEVMAAETLIIALMTVGSETAIRIKTAIDSSLQTQGLTVGSPLNKVTQSCCPIKARKHK